MLIDPTAMQITSLKSIGFTNDTQLNAFGASAGVRGLYKALSSLALTNDLTVCGSGGVEQLNRPTLYQGGVGDS